MLAGKTPRDAAVAAGYSAKSADSHASRMLRIPAIAEAVQKSQAKVLERLSVKAEDVVSELAKVAFAEEVSPVKVRALELLGKHLQLFVERVDLRVDAMSPEERAARAAALLATARVRLLAGGGGGGGGEGGDD
jgi:phage terminase small subunit